MSDKPVSNPWLLTVFAVPSHLVAVVNRFGLEQNKKKTCWYVTFEVNDNERTRARKIIAHLKQAGLRFSWKQVPRKTRLPSKTHHLPHHGPRGAINFAVHNRTPGTYRLKKRRR